MDITATVWTLLPPIIAIALALITKEVYSSLLIGILAGALVYTGFNPLHAVETTFEIMGGKLGDNINIWSGNDDQVVPLMALGAKGVISVVSNVYPQLMAEMTQLCLDGKFDEAAKLQVSTIGLVDALFIEVNPIPVKVALNMMGLDAGMLRMPLCDMSAAHKEVLAKALMNAGLEVKNPTAGA